MNANVHLVTIVADDLTGTLDTAQGFAVRGHETAVVPVPADGHGDATPASPVVGVNTDSRYADAERAAPAVRDVVESVPAETVYKKVDSTLRGNIGAETDAALAASGAPAALVAPAFPEAGRTTEAGRHYVHGTPLDETEYADDEKGASSAAVPALFEGFGRRVEHVPASDVEAGAERVRERLDAAIAAAEHAPVVVCDARDEDDLSTIARAGAERDPLYVGSGGLAKHVHVPDPEAEVRAGPEPGAGAPLGVVGSVSETTLTQLDALPEAAIVELDPSAVLTPGPAEAAVERASERLASGRPAVVTAATGEDAVERTVAVGRDRGLSDAEIRERVATGLAATGAAVVRAEAPAGLFYTGGDVAVAGLRALDAAVVELAGEAVETGIPLGWVADGDAAGTRLATKAGGFGERETIVNCLEALAGNDE
ncbi:MULTISPECIES: four-carbon acid sugar kinase family protein [Haloarcula]|uniref:four-carbon acid sugar kinase family protein n=1 Tax=Haloarcula TaxID=2237 RepID=UPI0023EB9DEB|nr:four-carbon acid sugar kinase family protein [Halomicroarcula sp. XH51]